MMENHVLLEMQTARTGLIQIALAHVLEGVEVQQAFVPEAGEQF